MASETLTAQGVTGYLHPHYAASLAEFGQPRRLPSSGAWLLVRRIPGSDRFDAMAGDRLLFCSDWAGLTEDLDAIHDLVTLTAVTDPFGPWEPAELRRSFPDLVQPYKEHFVVDLRRLAPSAHHRAKVRNALRSIDVRVEADPILFLDEWEELYSHLRARHNLSGMRAFSGTAFERQLATPGCVAVRSLLEGVCVSMTIWYVMGDIAYSHLTASSEAGYRSSASYASMQAAVETFTRQGLRWLNLGAGAGTRSSNDGLTYFKRGWATGSRPSYLCGRIFDRSTYEKLAGTGTPQDSYFPAYRRGEFG